MPLYLDSYDLHQPVWIFEMRKKCTYKLQLRRLMDWESISSPTVKDPVMWDPFILHATNVDVRMLHGYRVLAPIWTQNIHILNPLQSIQDADTILPVEIYMLCLSTFFQCWEKLCICKEDIILGLPTDYLEKVRAQFNKNYITSENERYTQPFLNCLIQPTTIIDEDPKNGCDILTHGYKRFGPKSIQELNIMLHRQRPS